MSTHSLVRSLAPNIQIRADEVSGGSQDEELLVLLTGQSLLEDCAHTERDGMVAGFPSNAFAEVSGWEQMLEWDNVL